MKEWIIKFLNGFYNAGKGIIRGFNERNMKVHGLMAIGVLLLGWYVSLSLMEWVIVLILIGIVFMAELFNSSIEELANIVKKKNYLDYEATRATRDLAAGAVLVVALMSAVVGVLIFWPKLF